MTTSELTTRRGQAASRILGDPDVMQALGEIETDLFNQWFATGPSRVEDREAIYRQAKAIELFQQCLETWRNNMLHLDATMVQRSLDQSGRGAEA